MDINDLSIEQLYELNEKICQRIDELRVRQDREALARLRPGMKVQFNNDGSVMSGTLIKRNRKTVLIASEDGSNQWKVPAGLVKPIEQ